MSKSLPEKVIEHITFTDQVMKKAAVLEKAAADKQAAVAQLIPNVVDTMVKFERIGPAEREKLAKMLTNPVTALELLIKVAGHRNTDEISRLGSPVTKTASVNGGSHDPAASLTSPFVGARTPMLKQSSVSLFRGLGLPVPAE